MYAAAELAFKLFEVSRVSRQVKLVDDNNDGAMFLLKPGKMPPNPGERAEASFHLVERDFGRFARAVRLTGAFHTARATATLANGELRVRVPKVEERRGRDIAVPVRRGPDA